jgi:TRAP transporter TAXI family solute receptor
MSGGNEGETAAFVINCHRPGDGSAFSYNPASIAGRGFVTTTSYRARSTRHARSRAAALLASALLASPWIAACSSGAPPPPPQALTLWSGIAPGFTTQLIERLNGALPQFSISLQTSAGGVEVVSEVDAGRGQLGLAQSDVVYRAYRRGIESNLYPHKNLRAIAVLWVNTLYVLVRHDSPFQSIDDLRERRVGIILPGTSGEFSTRILLDAHDMSYDDVQTVFRPTNTLLPMLGSGEIEAVFSANPVMLTAARALAQTVPLRLLPIGRPVINQLRGSYPFLRPVTIAANELPGQSAPIETLGSDWLLVCHGDLPEEVVYQLTREFFEQLPGLARTHGEAALIDPDQAPATPIPLHAGAARYYREREVLR